jgi:hypothetical protein
MLIVGEFLSARTNVSMPFLGPFQVVRSPSLAGAFARCSSLTCKVAVRAMQRRSVIMALSYCRFCGEPQEGVKPGAKAPVHTAQGQTKKCLGSKQTTTVR